ncbi:MAG: hypothetical protein Q4C70_12380, partial [Planctomycetia bacterium]|nr:hypothetical protein [Planctomycetia bacterium]
MSLSRRNFLKTSAVASTLPILGSQVNCAEVATEESATSTKPTKWYKGQLHTHSQWSDGSGMPESVAAVYKERGYEFLCLSDHNGFQNAKLQFSGFGFSKAPADKSAFEGENSTWKFVNDKKGWAQLNEAHYKQAQEKFGTDSVKMKVVDGVTYVRLKTFDELQAQFDEPGKFLLIPGFEQTGSSKDGLQVHMGFVNVTKSSGYIQKEHPAETVYENMVAGEALYKDNAEPYLFILNHPQWPYYDISPDVLVKLSQVRFFELTNNPRTGGPEIEKAWDPEKYWDVVNAFRIANNKPILWGTGSDDAHSIDPNNLVLGPFWGWNMVRSEELTTKGIMNAMIRGDFYVSTGVTLKDIQFCKETGTLSVSVDSSAGDGVKIEFIGTKKIFDRKSETTTTEKPARTIDVYAENIGTVLKTVDGLEGSYTLQPDDLYVRARVTSAESKETRNIYEILVPCAWTQPYV